MLKRNIAILIAGGLLGAQVNLAAADQGTFPSNDTEVIWKPLPAQLKYLEERAASIQKEPVAAAVLRDGIGLSPSGLALIGVAGYATVIGGRVIPLQPPALRTYLYVTRQGELDKEAREKAARGDVYKTVKVDASTKNVTVEHLGTVKFANDKGQSFVWTCDALGEHVVPLKAIAPAGFEAGDTTIYVRHPAAHIPG